MIGATILIVVLKLQPHFALLIGLVIAFTVGNSLNSVTKPLTKILLQICVVGLGFGMNFDQVAKAGQSGFLFTVATIAGALLLGALLGKLLNVEKKIAYLISAGTAICGGSAIAAVSPVVDADDKEISVAMGTVFTLNAIALLLFPFIGHYFHLSQAQFGLWSAIAIHDTSSVVGASSAYGAEAMTIATTVKLARALWIIPLTIASAFLFGKKAGMKAFPMFILYFVAASLLNTYLPINKEVSTFIVQLSKMGLSITLLMIGAGISMKSLKAVGFKALLMGVILWLVLLLASLWAVMAL
jgi:uncharacterized integral membrane protein (TIGR00698 family)